jgi:hypothetical protein
VLVHLGRVYRLGYNSSSASAAVVAASQTPAAAGNLTLTAGTSVTSVTTQYGTVLQLDVPRAVSVTTSAAVLLLC